MLEDGVEKRFDVHLALLLSLVQIYLYVSARNHLAVESVFDFFSSVIEVKLFRDFRYRCIHKHVLLVKDDDRVDDVLKVAYLVGRDKDYRVLSCVLCHGLSELRL